MAVKILIVDDEPDLESLITQKFRKEVRQREYELYFASDGVEALKKLESDHDIELVLTDINMPRMDGLALLSKLDHLDLPILKAVIVSAYGDLENIRTAMNRGAFDFLTKPIDLSDLEKTVKKACRELRQLRESIRARTQLLAIQHELDIATKIQQSIVPSRFPAFPERNDFDIYGAMIPARQVGGDLFDFFLLKENRLGFVVADVSGKGTPAAIYMAVCRGLLRAVASTGPSAGECLEKVNEMLCADNATDMFVTVFYGILNTTTGHLEYCNGGHNPPYVLQSDHRLTELEGPCGMVLGVRNNEAYETKSVTLQPGDSLLMFTDGVTEAMNTEEKFYSEEKLTELLRRWKGKSARELVESVVMSVKDFSGGAPQADDITVLALQYDHSEKEVSGAV